MKIRVLGSSSGEPVPHRSASAYLLTQNDLQILVDAGDGVARQMACFGIDPRYIDAVLISHTHPDHTAGLFLLIQHMFILKRSKPLNVFIPEKVLEPFKRIFPVLNIFEEMLLFPLQLKPVSRNILFEDHDLLIRAISNGHMKPYESFAEKHRIQPESYSFILRSRNRACLYTADIDDIEPLRSEASGIDLLLSECAHVEPGDVLSFAESLYIRHVAITHILPDREQRIQALRSDRTRISIVHDGDTIEV